MRWTRWRSRAAMPPLRQSDDALTLAFNAGRQEGYADGYEDGYRDAQAGRPKQDVR